MAAKEEDIYSKPPYNSSSSYTLLQKDIDELFCKMVEEATDGKFILGLDEICYVNPSFCCMLGYACSEIESKKPRDFFLLDEQKQIRDEMEMILQGDVRMEEDLDLVSKDGLVVHCHAEISPIYKGNCSLLYGTIRRKCQQAVDPFIEDCWQDSKNNDKVQRIEGTELKYTSAILAHEIRNSIMTVTGCLQLLKEEDNVGITEAEIMMEEMNRAERLLDIFLSFRQIGCNSYEKMDINSLIEPYMTLMHGLLAYHQIKLINRLDHSQPAEVILHVDKMKQVVINICKNAIEAMSLGGTLTVASQVEADSIHISFIDNGPGISPESMKKIMNPYFTTRSKGTGLGLSVSRNIVKKHGGELSIQSEEGQGTTVTITLPLVGQKEQGD